MTSNFRMTKPQWISKQCKIDVSNCWNELYRDTSWLPCSKCLPLYQILNQTNVWAIHLDKSCWFVVNRESVRICLNYLFSYSASGKWFETLQFWNGNKTSNFLIFVIEVLKFYGSVTQWPGRPRIVIFWSRVQTLPCYSLGFRLLSVQPCDCSQSTSVIFPSLTKYYPCQTLWLLTDAENYLNMVHNYCVKTENTK